MNYGTLVYRAPGTLRYGAGQTNQRGMWGILAKPHVAIRLKRIFPKAHAGKAGMIVLADTIDTARDIEWVLDRWPLDAEPDVLERLHARADAWRERTHAIDAILSGHHRPLPLDDAGMTPRDYQQTAVDLAVATRRLLLADDLGLGKTITAAFLLAAPDALPALIVVPTHMVRHWMEKVQAVWPGLHLHAARKGSPYPLPYTLSGPPDVLVMGYAKLAGWADALAGQVRTVIFDEVQDLRHGEGTAKGRAAARIAADANYALGLSATPVYNYGIEIWNIMSILAPDSLGARDEFIREWEASGVGGKESVKDPAALGEYLRDQGLMLRRTRKEVGKANPEPIIITESVASNPEALDEVAGDVEKMARLILDGTSDRKQRFIAAGDLDWRLRQATGVGKAPFVAEFVRLLLESEDKIVLWGWHRAVYDIWVDRLAEFNPVLYTGSESPTQKNRAEDAFIRGDARVLIMSLRSGAGLDGLQEVCSVGVFGELDWSPEQHRQCIGRLDRDGQRSKVAAYYLVSDDGSDPVIADVLQIKRQQAEPIRDPQAPLFKPVRDVSRDRVKMLARATLDRTGSRRSTA